MRATTARQFELGRVLKMTPGRLTDNRVTRSSFARTAISEARYRVARGDRPKRPSTPIIVSCHHKSGSTLMRTIFLKICDEFGWRFQWHGGDAPSELPSRVDVLGLGHAHFDLSKLRIPYRSVHLIRDPRDVIASGYEYHLRTDEPWCVNSNLDESPPITAPRVPMWLESCSEEWKRAYLRSLGGRSYQEHLRSLTPAAGITFEMTHYGTWTIERMLAWDYDDPNSVELRFEDVLADFDAEMRRMFAALGLTDRWLERAIEIAATEDLGRMDADRLALDPHIQSRGVSRWERHLTDEHRAAFKERFGDAVVRLGYELSNDW